jgi:hypothetical protein
MDILASGTTIRTKLLWRKLNLTLNIGAASSYETPSLVYQPARRHIMIPPIKINLILKKEFNNSYSQVHQIT